MSGRTPLLRSDPSIGKDRRRFIIISIFDATLCILLWLICTVTKGDDWPDIFLKEIDIFAPNFIHYSLFDVVLCSIFRMIVLILCYAVLVLKQWYPVAITTTISSTFLIAKALLFFSKTQSALPQYLLVLTSFSIAWFELWLMPFKVLAREQRYARHRNSTSFDEEESIASRSALVSGGPPRLRNPRIGVLSANATHSLHFSTDDDFRSAQDGSSDEEVVTHQVVYPQLPAMLRDTYERAMSNAESEVDSLLRKAKSGTWKVLRSDDPMVLLGDDGSYFIMADFNCPALILFECLWKDVIKWNPLVLEGKSVLKLDSNTELYYSISAPAMKGYIASRDFCDIRRLHLESDAEQYSGVFVSVESTLCPPNAKKKIVRGVNGPSLIRVRRGDNACEAHMEWIMKTDLRGGLPKRLVQSSMLNYFIEHVDRLRKHVDQLTNAANATNGSN